MRKLRFRRKGKSPKKSGLSNISALLNEARKCRVAGSGIADPNVVKRSILSGHYTRERACDTKARFGCYEHALKAASDIAKRGYIDFIPLVPYACPFCGGFHLATDHDAVSR